MKNLEEPPKDMLVAEGGMTTEALADALDELQKVKNNGRGVSCVEEIVMWLRDGDIRKARAVAIHDFDKIGDVLDQNKDIKELVKTELFRGEDKHPWSFLEKFQQERIK